MPPQLGPAACAGPRPPMRQRRASASRLERGDAVASSQATGRTGWGTAGGSASRAPGLSTSLLCEVKTGRTVSLSDSD